MSRPTSAMELDGKDSQSNDSNISSASSATKPKAGDNNPDAMQDVGSLPLATNTPANTAPNNLSLTSMSLNPDTYMSLSSGSNSSSSNNSYNPKDSEEVRTIGFALRELDPTILQGLTSERGWDHFKKMVAHVAQSTARNQNLIQRAKPALPMLNEILKMPRESFIQAYSNTRLTPTVKASDFEWLIDYMTKIYDEDVDPEFTFPDDIPTEQLVSLSTLEGIARFDFMYLQLARQVLFNLPKYGEAGCRIEPNVERDSKLFSAMIGWAKNNPVQNILNKRKQDDERFNDPYQKPRGNDESETMTMMGKRKKLTDKFKWWDKNKLDISYPWLAKSWEDIRNPNSSNSNSSSNSSGSSDKGDKGDRKSNTASTSSASQTTRTGTLSNSPSANAPQQQQQSQQQASTQPVSKQSQSGSPDRSRDRTRGRSQRREPAIPDTTYTNLGNPVAGQSTAQSRPTQPIGQQLSASSGSSTGQGPNAGFGASMFNQFLAPIQPLNFTLAPLNSNSNSNSSGLNFNFGNTNNSAGNPPSTLPRTVSSNTGRNNPSSASQDTDVEMSDGSQPAKSTRSGNQNRKGGKGQ